MHRFYLPPNECQGAALRLTGREAHHGLHVLRLRPGERVTVLDGAGQECQCDVQTCEQNQVRLRVIERRMAPPLPYQLTLVQALPKGKLFESILQKATELGAVRIVPLLSERVVVRLGPGEAERRKIKWQELAVEAIKQCGSTWLPQVDMPLTPGLLLARNEAFELALIGSLQSDSRHPREYFKAFQREHGRKPTSVCVWVGPEGDFSPAELAAIQGCNVRPITLGRLVLRAETAAVYCLSALNYELQSAD